MRNLIEDIFRFVLAHKVGIELAPLQVYSSALIFSPSSSIVRRIYEDTEGPKWIIIKPEMPVEWTAHVQSLEGNKSLCEAMEFSPDGAQIASAFKDKRVRIWDLETGMCLHTLKCSEVMRLLAFSPNGKHLATGSFFWVEIWDLSTSARLFVYKSKAFISSLAFSLNGTQFAASYSDIDSYIRTWDLATGIELKTHKFGPGTAKARCTAFAPDGTQFACVENRDDEWIHIWNLTTDRYIPVLRMNRLSRLISPKFSANAARLAAATDYTIHIFATSTGACMLKIGQVFGLHSLNLSVASNRLTAQSYPGHFKIWDAVTGECLRQSYHYQKCRKFAVSPDGMLVASGISEIEIWDMTIDGPIDAFKATTIWAAVVSPDGTQLAIASPYLAERCVIKILDPTTGIRLKKFEYAQERIIDSMVFFPDGKRLVSVGRGIIEIWNVSSGVSLQLINLGGQYRFTSDFAPLAVSPNGTHLAIIPSSGANINVMYLPAGNKFQRIAYSDNRPHSSPVAMAFSPDGTQLGLTLESGVVQIYDVQTGVCLRDFDNFFEPLLHDFGFTKLRLQTDLRIFGYRDCIKAPPTGQALMRRGLSAFTVYEKGTWIMRGKQRVLWLPPEYRPSKVEIHDGFFICRTDRGRYLCFQLAVGELGKVLA